MGTPRRHAEVIKQWADGAQIQSRICDKDKWIDEVRPQWYDDYQYRVKPVAQKIKYRNYFYTTGGRKPQLKVAALMDTELTDAFEEYSWFKGWVGSWKELEVECTT